MNPNGSQVRVPAERLIATLQRTVAQLTQQNVIFTATIEELQDQNAKLDAENTKLQAELDSRKRHPSGQTSDTETGNASIKAVRSVATETANARN
jgi:regulator of replication initiation timing